MATASPEPRRGASPESGRVADLIVSVLRRAGVRTLFGVPGGGSNLDVIAAAGRADLPFVLTATETAGAIAAMAQAEITGQVGACLTTLGPGAASVVNGVACAFLDRAPIVVLTDSHPAGGTFEHQRLDQAALLNPVTKSSESLTPDNALQAITRAIHTATDRRPGPVHLDCPGDVAAASTSTTGATLLGSVRHTLLPADRARLEGLLGHARKPLLLVGLGARRAADAAAIRDLSARHHVPVMVTYKAKGVVPDDDPWFAGVFTNATIEQPIIDESDLLIGIGLDPVELVPRTWKREQPVVYAGPWGVDDAHVPCDVQFVTDVPNAVKEFERLLPASQWDPDRVRQHLDEQRRRIDIPAGGLSSQRVVQIAASRLAGVAGRVTVDAGAHMFPATMLWPVCAPNGMLISNGLSTMGFALPAAIGAALVDREKPVVALTGDGGLLMCVGELLTAVREHLRIIIIVFSDASLSLIEIKQQARRMEPAGVALGAIDWPALAGSFGAASWAAADEAELERAIERALTCEGPSLIEAKIDRSNYGATLRAVRG
jgi:acetolactate synthase-1/2/3 large subunit